MKESKRSTRVLLAAFAIEVILALFCVVVFLRLARTPKPPLESQRGAETRLVWINSSGVVTHSLDVPGHFILPRIVPNQDAVLLTQAVPGDVTIWSLSFSTGKLSRLPAGGLKGRTAFAIASPDGSEFAFSRWKRDLGSPVLASFSTSARHYLLPPSYQKKYSIIPMDWASNGLILLARTNVTKSDLLIARANNGAIYPFLKLPPKIHAFDARFSPDGKWIVFTSDISGRDEIYLAKIPARLEALPLPSGDLIRVSKQGGHSPEWGNNGEVLYLAPGGNLVSWTQQMRETHLIVNISKLGTSGFSYRYGGYAFDRPRNLILFTLDNIDIDQQSGHPGYNASH